MTMPEGNVFSSQMMVLHYSQSIKQYWRVSPINRCCPSKWWFMNPCQVSCPPCFKVFKYNTSKIPGRCILLNYTRMDSSVEQKINVIWFSSCLNTIDNGWLVWRRPTSSIKQIGQRQHLCIWNTVSSKSIQVQEGGHLSRANFNQS